MEMLMPEVLPKYEQATLWDTPNAIGSLEADFGRSRSGKQDGQTNAKFGQEARHARVFPWRAKDKGLQTLVTSGLIGCDSSASADLQSSLENKFVQRLDTAGSTLFNLTWKHKTTPLGRSYLERAASARRTSDKDFTGWRSPNARLNGGGDYSDPKKAAKRIEQGHQLKLSEEVLLSSWSTPMAGTPAQNGYNEAGNNDSSRKTVALAAWPTPCTPNGDRSVSTEVMDATGKMLDGRKHTASLEHAVKFAGPVRLTASGEMLTGSDAGMGDFGQLDGAHSLWLQGIPAEWRNFVWRAMQSAFLQRKRSLKPTSKRNGNK
jgi:hypothetical protein